MNEVFARDGAQVWARQNMSMPLRQRLGLGSTVLYTARSPTKETVNEDAVALVAVRHDAAVLIVADGLGGLPSGDTASSLVVHTLTEQLLAAAASGAVIRDAVLDGIEKANAMVLAQGSGAASTLAVVELQGNTMRSYHVGDSLILLSGQRGKIKFQSVAHSPVGYAVEAGWLDEEEAVHHEERNIVSNVIGSAAMRIDVGPAVTLAPRDTLTVASDGLADNLYMGEIVEAVRAGSLDQAGKALLETCRERMLHPQPGLPSHPDDLSFIIYRPLTTPGRQ